MLIKALAVVTLDIEIGCRCEAVLAGSLDDADREALEAGALPDSAAVEGSRRDSAAGDIYQRFVISLPARPDGAAGCFAYCAFHCRRDSRLPRLARAHTTYSRARPGIASAYATEMRTC